MESPYSSYIVHPGKIAQANDLADAAISNQFRFNKIGIHHLTLPPNSRTSLPHAESLEEEFALVVAGQPHVWIDGYLHELKPHMAVGFPAGTGIAHTFINNSSTDVQLLVAGERTKKENRCYFPLNPEQKMKLPGLWWADSPNRTLGPHNGQPGPVQPQELGGARPSFIVDCESISRRSGWHYPGDSETFGEYARLTPLLGLKALGVGFETLQPGKRSAFPHAHKAEEEFLFVLNGIANVWMNGFLHEVRAGSGVAFAPGTNIAHCVINNSTEPLTYIAFGEATDDNNEDRILYPQHPFRNAQCVYHGDIWSDPPVPQAVGPHDGRPNAGLGEHFALRHAFFETDMDVILEIFGQSPDYFKRVDGCTPTMSSVKKAIEDTPKNRLPSYRKEFLFLDYRDKPVGVADIHIDHPAAGGAYIGLLLLVESQFGKGLGRRFYELIEHYLKSTYKVKTVRLGISAENDVSKFWRKLGFEANGRSYTWTGENKTTNILEFEKALI